MTYRESKAPKVFAGLLIGMGCLFFVAMAVLMFFVAKN